MAKGLYPHVMSDALESPARELDTSDPLAPLDLNRRSDQRFELVKIVLDRITESGYQNRHPDEIGLFAVQTADAALAAMEKKPEAEQRQP